MSVSVSSAGLLSILLLGCGGKAPTKKAGPNNKTEPLPSECHAGCVTPYGTPLGANEGVVGYSNCQPACIDPTPNDVDNTFTGIRWQCVEYARRWWLQKRGIVFGSVDTADAMWAEVTEAQHPSSMTTRAVVRFENGGGEAPLAGDLVIYRADPNNTDLLYGHVAVIVRVDLASKKVWVAEQNFSNKPWQDAKSYSRSLTIGEAFALGDGSEAKQIYGWLRANPDPATP